jgi:hypothetical protein
METIGLLDAAGGRGQAQIMELLHSVAEFFHDEVKDALRAKHVAAAEPTECYLVNVLVEFTSQAPDGEPLTLKLAEAQAATPDCRVRVLREVGDTSLYMSGFFAESLSRKLVDVDYYMALGGTAYRQLAGMTSGSSFRDIYAELSAKFAAYVDVFGAIRDKTGMAAGGNLIRMYEEWRRTGSEWLEKRLRESGVLLGDAQNGNRA